MKVESEIWDLEAKLELFLDHFGTLVPFGTKSRIRDFFGAPACCGQITFYKKQMNAKEHSFAKDSCLHIIYMFWGTPTACLFDCCICL